MKNYLILVFIGFLSCFNLEAQQTNVNNPHHVPFVGVWEYSENSQIFRVTIYEDGIYLKGDYELVEVNNGIETPIYKSNFYVPEYDLYAGYAIFGGSHDGVFMFAQIDDNTINYDQGILNRLTKDGSLSLTIIPPDISCRNQNCPVQARWKIDETKGMKLDSDPEHYNIPTDVIMTKVN